MPDGLDQSLAKHGDYEGRAPECACERSTTMTFRQRCPAKHVVEKNEESNGYRNLSLNFVVVTTCLMLELLGIEFSLFFPT